MISFYVFITEKIRLNLIMINYLHKTHKTQYHNIKFNKIKY